MQQNSQVFGSFIVEIEIPLAVSDRLQMPAYRESIDSIIMMQSIIILFISLILILYY